SSSFGTATRTISQPALASEAICAVVAGTSWVFVSVIDCTTTGTPPPIWTPPTLTERSLPTRLMLAAARKQVVPQPEVEQEREQRDADRAVAEVGELREGTPPDPLEDRHHDVSSVERQDRQQVEEGQREADVAEEEEVVLERLPVCGGGVSDDPDRAR